jgi:hypothetical protein
MRPWHCFSIVSLLALLAAATAAADPLWQKAVEIAGRSLERLPTRALFRLELPGDKGFALGTYLTWYRISRDPEGSIVMDTVRAMNNGVEVAPRERDGQEKLYAAGQRKKGAPPFDLGNNPFDPAVQESVSASPDGRARRVAGRECAGYRYSIRRPDGTLQEGTAWIEQGTGVPVEAAFTVKPLPQFVFQMTTTMSYGAVSADDGCLRESTVDGEAGLLFFRQHFRTTVTLSGYSSVAFAGP